MDKEVKLKDEPVAEKSPDLSKSANGDNPVTEGDGTSIRNQMNKKEEKNYPLPNSDDKRFEQQDEYNAVDKENRQ